MNKGAALWQVILPLSAAHMPSRWMPLHWWLPSFHGLDRLHDPHFASTQALASADVLLIAAGAGFSADSGLPVYDSIAVDQTYASLGVTYSDLCSPQMMAEQPDLFYGFWGTCCNMYATPPFLHYVFVTFSQVRERAAARRVYTAEPLGGGGAAAAACERRGATLLGLHQQR